MSGNFNGHPVVITLGRDTLYRCVYLDRLYLGSSLTECWVWVMQQPLASTVN